MLEPTVIRPEIALNDFLPIFLSSSFVLLFGLFFVAIYTLVKLDVIKKVYMPFAYLFWMLQTYCMYYVATTIGSEAFTVKALMITMLAYLTLPHLYYYLNQKAHEKYEN
ncbi:MAG: hypothetical protein ACO29X_04725 [Arcobacteraceae bacterium]|jgi:hypothetical protein